MLLPWPVAVSVLAYYPPDSQGSCHAGTQPLRLNDRSNKQVHIFYIAPFGYPLQSAGTRRTHTHILLHAFELINYRAGHTLYNLPHRSIKRKSCLNTDAEQI